MRLFVAEKPSLAEAVAGACGRAARRAPTRHKAWWEIGRDRVTWLYGHMFDLAEPEVYEPRLARWSLDALPVAAPRRWRRVPHADKRAHLAVVTDLIRKARWIVHCGDAGREGQLLVDEVLEEAGIDPFSPHVLRLWVRSMVEADLDAALAALEPNARRRSLSLAAWTRRRADWLHGLNHTRLFTLLHRERLGGGEVLSIGRVQTPTLRLVVERDHERENFVPTDHFRLRVRFAHPKGEFWALWQPPEGTPELDGEGRLLTRAPAEAARARILGNGREPATVVSCKEERRTLPPPPPFSLSALQTACARTFRMTAKEVLDTAQALYETHRLATYPRTDSRHLPRSLLRDEARGILSSLLRLRDFQGMAALIRAERVSAAWDDTKVGDHHAIIPTRAATPERVAALPEREARVFRLIARSFIAQFLPDGVRLLRTARIVRGDDGFAASGEQILEPGWTVLHRGEREAEGEEAGEEAGIVPPMTRGDVVRPLAGVVDALRTAPPPAHTDGTLIAAMTRAHLQVRDPELRRRLREVDGIGTEATRAEVIETLLRRGLVERRGRTAMVSTARGRRLLELLPADLADPGLTALWEGQLRRIEEGTLSDQAFLAALEESIRRRVEALRTSVPAPSRPLPARSPRRRA